MAPDDDETPDPETSLLGKNSAECSLRPPLWAAQFLGVSEAWVMAAAERGELPCIRFESCIRFDPVVIKRWVRRLSGNLNPDLSAPDATPFGSLSAEKLDALLQEARAMRELLQKPAPAVPPPEPTKALLPPARLLSFRQAAKHLGVDRARLSAWVSQGLVRTVKVDGKPRIPASELDRLEAQGIEPRHARPRAAARTKSAGAAIRALKL